MQCIISVLTLMRCTPTQHALLLYYSSAEVLAYASFVSSTNDWPLGAHAWKRSFDDASSPAQIALLYKRGRALLTSNTWLCVIII